MQVSAMYGNLLDKKENTLIFLDEIQAYPHLITMLKFLKMMISTLILQVVLYLELH